MTWIMFDEIILHPESGAYFYRNGWNVQYYNGLNCQPIDEKFKSEEQAQQRFEELKKLLIRRPRLLINTEGTFKEILNGEEV